MIPISGTSALLPRTTPAAACTRSYSDIATVMSRSPNSRVPILIIVAPSSTATGKSPDMPIDSSGSR